MVTEMERQIQALGAPPVRNKEAFFEYQKAQVDNLVDLERRWRDQLVKGRRGRELYELFCDHVEQNLPSTLSARSYFRERQEAFDDRLGKYLAEKDWKGLAKYRVNYRFIAWAMSTGKLGVTHQKLADKIARKRQEMVLLLMPLAISQARIFYGRTPESHLSIRDLVQISFEGLMAAVDKFVPPFSAVYRSVALGRAKGLLIEEYSETLLHFFPTDRKILYRANKLVGKMDGGMDGVDYDDMAKRLNDGAAPYTDEDGVNHPRQFTTDARQVATLMAASSCVSADATVAARRSVSRSAAPEEARPDVQAEDNERRELLRAAVLQLSVPERKLLAMRGVISPEEV